MGIKFTSNLKEEDMNKVINYMIGLKDKNNINIVCYITLSDFPIAVTTVKKIDFINSVIELENYNNVKQDKDYELKLFFNENKYNTIYRNREFYITLNETK